MSYAIHEAIFVALLSALDKDSYLMCINGAISHLFFGILVSMNFRNSGKMLLILVREFWNLVIEKSGNFTFYDLWEPCIMMRSDRIPCMCLTSKGRKNKSFRLDINHSIKF